MSQRPGEPRSHAEESATVLAPAIGDLLKRDAAGLVCAVVQDARSGEVLMVGWMNDEALAATLATRQATFFSRSRARLWRKGEESGNTLHVREVRLDCDGDAVLVRADPAGPTCHTGTRSCFTSRVLLAEADATTADEQPPELATTPGPTEAGGVG